MRHICSKKKLLKYRGRGRENSLLKLNSKVSVSGKKRPSLKRVFIAGCCFSNLFLNMILKCRENICGLKLFRSMRGFPKFINSFLVTTGKWDAIDFKTINLLTRVEHAGLLVMILVSKVIYPCYLILGSNTLGTYIEV